MKNYAEVFDILIDKIEDCYKNSNETWKKKFPGGFNRPTQEETNYMDYEQFEERIREFGNERFQRGETIAYASLLHYAKMLKEEMEYYEQQERAAYDVAPEEDMD